MKICLVGCLPIEQGGKNKGGIASHISELLINLKLSSVDVELFANDVNTDSSAKIVTYNSKLQIIIGAILGGIKFGWVKDDSYNLKQKVKILADAHVMTKLSDNGVTIFHIHSLHNLASKSCEIAGLNYIVSDHGYWQKKTESSNITNNIKLASKVISISNFSRDNILKLGVDKDILVKINNPISRTLVAKDVRDNIFRVYFNGISDGWDRKGLSYISAELETLVDIENIEITIVSDEKSLDKIEKQHPWISNSNKIVISPPLPQSENLQQLANSDVYLAPSLSEGFSIAYLESVQLSVPVIGFKSNVDEINELLGSNYCLSFEHSIDKIYDKVMQLKRREPFTSLNIDNLTWENNISKYIQIYRELSNKG